MSPHSQRNTLAANLRAIANEQDGQGDAFETRASSDLLRAAASALERSCGPAERDAVIQECLIAVRDHLPYPFTAAGSIERLACFQAVERLKNAAPQAGGAPAKQGLGQASPTARASSSAGKDSGPTMEQQLAIKEQMLKYTGIFPVGAILDIWLAAHKRSATSSDEGGDRG